MKKTTYFSIFILLFFSVTAFGQVTSSGLIACYPMNNNPNDYSGNNNNGTIIVGVTPTMDRFGNPNSAYQFNNGYISVSAKH